MGRETEPSPPEAAAQDSLPTCGFRGDGASYPVKNLLPECHDFYLCAEGEMIRGVTLVVDKRFAGSHVYTETYY